jgi:hypothetical protein
VDWARPRRPARPEHQPRTPRRCGRGFGHFPGTGTGRRLAPSSALTPSTSPRLLRSRL